MATATRRRPKKVETEEEQAKALNAMPDPETEAAVETNLEAQLEAESDADAEAQADPPTIGEVIADGAKEIMGDQIARTVLDQIDDEHRKAKAFDEIAELNDAVEKAFTTWSLADKRAKDLKKAYEGAVAELRGLISATAHPAPMPLFDGKTADAEADKPATVEVTPPDDAWKNIPLREALPELSDTVFTKLEGAQLFTMGELANWTAADGGRRRLADIAGIGPGTAGKIEEATMAFWSRWKPAPAATPEAESTDAVDDAFRMVPIDWPLVAGPDVPGVIEAKIKTIGDLEDYAASHGLSIFDALKYAGFDGVAADDVVQWLKDTRDEMKAS